MAHGSLAGMPSGPPCLASFAPTQQLLDFLQCERAGGLVKGKDSQQLITRSGLVLDVKACVKDVVSGSKGGGVGFCGTISS